MISRLIGRIERRIYSIFVKNSTSVTNSVYKSDLSLGKSCTVANCNFGRYNRIGEGSYLDNSSLGDFTYCGKNATIINCKVGKFCSIAQGVSIGLGMHPVNEFVSTHPSFYSVHKQCGLTFADKQYFDEMGTVEIGNDVWLGANAIVLDNVRIGDGAIVAANSVVTKDVPPYAIVGGTPAKFIKYRFEEQEIQFLQTFKWWDRDIEWLKKNFTLFHDIKKLNQFNQ